MTDSDHNIVAIDIGARLEKAGHVHWKQKINNAIAGGATETEICLRLGAVLRKLKRSVIDLDPETKARVDQLVVDLDLSLRKAPAAEIMFEFWCYLTAAILIYSTFIEVLKFFWRNPYVYLDAFLWLLAGLGIRRAVKKIMGATFILWLLSLPLLLWLVWWSFVFAFFYLDHTTAWIKNTFSILCDAVFVVGYFYAYFYLYVYRKMVKKTDPMH